MATFKLQVIAPDRNFYDGDVEKVVFRGSEGDMAILKNHIPMATILSMGELKIFTDSKKSRNATLINGFAKIETDKVVILTDAAEWPEEIDLKRAELAKDRAEKRLKESETDYIRASSSLKRAIIRIELTKSLNK